MSPPIQSNWILKKYINIRRNAPASTQDDIIPPGRLRAVSVATIAGGVNTRNVRFRVEGNDYDLEDFSAAAAGFGDWIAMQSSGMTRDNTVVYMYINSRSAMRVQIQGNANEDSHPVQLGFWYEPESTEDDAQLAPLTVGRGGENRT